MENKTDVMTGLTARKLSMNEYKTVYKKIDADDIVTDICIAADIRSLPAYQRVALAWWTTQLEMNEIVI